MPKQPNHINENTILWTLIDPDRLSAYEKEHLNGCQSCMEKSLSIKNELNELKDLSHRLMPKPRRNLRPITTVQTVSPQLFKLKHALVYTLMLVVCVGGVLGIWPTQEHMRDDVAIEEATQFIQDMRNSPTSNHNGTYSILPTSLQYIAADEFDIMSNPFYDYVFPITAIAVDGS